ncbi:alpha/beta hydrolase [Nocardia australiensis]|uniref:alpha/beta hydrolase n=1 Tax=Nocardia australiensis TaxID=2887191 RepID=UPI001D15043C|nr:alpha/beta hydrolase family protein [Nocardia australiensis]
MPSKLLTALVCTIAASIVLVEPAAAAPPGSQLVRESPIDDRVSRVDVYSPSMDRVISNRVIRAAGDGPAPTLYLLTGLGGGEDGISWWDNTDIREFFADKHVNVVLPIGGAYSMYTDWLADDPAVGRQRWQTYLTRELPALVDDHFATTERNAIAGVSMSAGSAVDLAIQAGDLYSAVAAYSGCPWSSDPVGMSFVSAQVLRGGGNTLNMWGTPGGDTWRAHDAFANAGRLAGKSIYLSAASGMPGTIDEGGIPLPPIEAIASACTAAMAGRLGQLGIPARHLNRPAGSHTWAQFEADLHDSWPLLARALGA